MIKLIILIVTFASFICGASLSVRSSLAIRDRMPQVLRGENTYSTVMQYYAFDRTVPRSVQRQYLLSLVLNPIAAAGFAALFYLSESYKGAVLFGAIACIGVAVSVMNWIRFRRASSKTLRE